MAILHMENYVTINRQRIYTDKNFDDAVYVQICCNSSPFSPYFFSGSIWTEHGSPYKHTRHQEVIMLSIVLP